ncbi:helix-turn-helix domain-containing protein [Brevundimonas sp. SORGH_AS_0993]|uniref:winged helix-turn-helix transcriptional regulator n=1 Tax=Brevundimonas sp. SORGH_AS_0993 TaxID=3041794 RepID=UPI002784E4C7|nr:helix-turn-helix domain-containing protein [Brevundimonas sp. SORGH_AS_0993]MDQ1153932.1 DNA-binding HxlR family transcriptional regulator [Brevundimonas sp. SORGH_AS_0993]
MQDGTFSLPSHLQETAPRGDVFAAQCPTRQLLDRIADKWSILILMTLGEGPLRFNGLKRRIEGVSQKMLSQTLRSLERDGLVLRTVEATSPVTVTYAVTPLGQTLMAAMQAMIVWAETRMPEVAASQARFDGRQAGLN